MLPSVTKWHQNELSSFQKVIITIFLHCIDTSEILRAIKLLPNAIKRSTQATKMKMCPNMLPCVTKWYQYELPSFLKVQITILLQCIDTSEILRAIKLLIFSKECLNDVHCFFVYAIINMLLYHFELINSTTIVHCNGIIQAKLFPNS